MNCLSRDQARKIVRDFEKLVHEWPYELKENIFSIVAYGSLFRSDFLDDISDIDILIVFNDDADERIIRETLDRIKEFESKYRRCEDYIILDIAWVYEKELPLKDRNSEIFFKFLTIYAFDFVENSYVIFGKDFRHQLKVLDPKIWVNKRLARLKKLLDKNIEEKNYKHLLIVSGEIIRLAQIVYGEPTIRKDEVIKLFIEKVPDYPEKEFAKSIWQEYYTPRHKKELNEEYIKKVIRFSKATLEIIKIALNTEKISD